MQDDKERDDDVGVWQRIIFPLVFIIVGGYLIVDPKSASGDLTGELPAEFYMASGAGFLVAGIVAMILSNYRGKRRASVEFWTKTIGGWSVVLCLAAVLWAAVRRDGWPWE